MIRHGFLRSAPPVFLLSRAMVQPRFGAATVTVVGAPMLFQSGYLATSRTAIALSPVAVRTDQELGSAFHTTAEPLSKDDFASASHVPRLPGGLDNAHPFVAL